MPEDQKKEKNNKKAHYLSRKESRDIAKSNKRALKELEAKNKRNVSEEQYITELKDSNNIVEFENLHLFAFPDHFYIFSHHFLNFDTLFLLLNHLNT